MSNNGSLNVTTRKRQPSLRSKTATGWVFSHINYENSCQRTQYPSSNRCPYDTQRERKPSTNEPYNRANYQQQELSHHATTMITTSDKLFAPIQSVGQFSHWKLTPTASTNRSFPQPKSVSQPGKGLPQDNKNHLLQQVSDTRHRTHSSSPHAVAMVTLTTSNTITSIGHRMDNHEHDLLKSNMQTSKLIISKASTKVTTTKDDSQSRMMISQQQKLSILSPTPEMITTLNNLQEMYRTLDESVQDTLGMDAVYRPSQAACTSK